MYKFLLCLSCIQIFLCSCSSFVPESTVLEVSINEPNQIRFTGKGSGAGMMLMGAMGPMGIAIGVAIDEGIAKDIDKVATEAGLDVESILRSHFSNVDNCSISSLRVERYGFSMLKGSDELAIPEIKIDIMIGTKQLPETKRLEYLHVESDDHLSAPLESLKTDGSLVKNMLTQAFEKLVTSACEITDLRDLTSLGNKVF